MPSRSLFTANLAVSKSLTNTKNETPGTSITRHCQKGSFVWGKGVPILFTLRTFTLTDNISEEFSTALLNAQTKIKHAIDNKAGPYATYASYEALHDAVVPTFNEEGIYVRQLSHERDNSVCIETRLEFKNESRSSGLVPVPIKGTGPQAFGSAMTYCRRYSLGLAAGIGHQTDDDAQAAEEQMSGAEETITGEDITLIEQHIQDVTFQHFYEKRLENDPNAKKPKTVDDLTLDEVRLARDALADT